MSNQKVLYGEVFKECLRHVNIFTISYHTIIPTLYELD